MDRIAKLRLKALDNKIEICEFFYKFYKRFTENGIALREKRYADAFCFAFSNLTPSISEDELIVGKYKSHLSQKEMEEWENIYCEIAKKESAKAGGGQASHMAVDYELILKKGLEGIISDIDGYLMNCGENKAVFYKTCKTCLEAVIKYSQNYAAEALSQVQNTEDEKRKAELLKLAEICAKVPAKPAESFYEAVQSVHFITHCLTVDPLKIGAHQFQLGHPDRYLLPYYIEDIQSGVITKEYAQLLLDCLGIQINMRVPRGLSSGYMVGGRDENGNIVENELTYMCMQVVDDIRLVYPSVGLCYTQGMSERCLERACEILSHGCSHPAIFNDDIISKGLISYGLTKEESHNYIHSTCVEITPVAASNVWVASPYTNLAQLLNDCLTKEYDSFDELLNEFYAKLDRSIKINFENENNMRKVRCENSLIPLLSCFVNDCLKRGVDIEQGGARYNWIMPSFVGVANVVDSLHVLRKAVFEEGEITVRELKKILDENFEGNEALRLHLLNDYSKYGNDIDEVDMYFEIITQHIVSECKKHNGIHSNAKLIPSVFCWEMHERLGRKTGATPDGRKAAFPLGDGSGPCQGREHNGPTASVLSSTKWAHHELIGGVAVNMKFSEKSLRAKSIDAMKAIIKTYLKRGGFEMQINVIDRETLEKARINPEEYRDIVVRIGGYSDYFIALSDEMQQEVILRTEHTI